MHLFLSTLSVFVSIELVSCDKVIVTSTGPAVLRTPIAFTARFVSEYSEWRYYYFEDDTSKRVVETQEGFDFATITVVYDKLTDFNPEKTYRMYVQVYNSIFGHRGFLVAQGYVDFKLSANLIGNISVAQYGLPPSAILESKVATNETANITVSLWDPLEYFKSARFYYSWTINDLLFKNISLLEYNFTTPQIYNISVIIDANVTNENGLQQFNGKIERSVSAKVPILSVVVLGKKVIPRDNDLNLTVKLDGSPPFWYCDSINEESRNVTRNFTCDSRSYILEPYFNVIRYLRTNGSYLLQMRIGNDVSTIEKKTVEITILGINNQPQLSFVIIPVTSCIVAVFIIIAGIGYHLKNKPNYTIEVADFDFQHHDDLVEKTLFERVRESFTASIKGDLLSACRRGTNYGSYINDDIITAEPTPVNSPARECSNFVGQ